MIRRRLATLCLLLAACGPSRHERCERNGGPWIAGKCHEEIVPVLVGKVVVPLVFTVCGHVCRGGGAEAANP